MSDDAPIPKTLDWYREAANWVVGLATAALGAAFITLGSISKLELIPRLAVIAGGLCLALAVSCGILFYFWLIALGQALENLAKEPTPAPTDEKSQMDHVRL